MFAYAQKVHIFAISKLVIKTITKMKLTQKALKSIDNPNCRMRIALALQVSDITVRRYISLNDDSLTKAAALKVIKKETGLKTDEILEKTLQA
jgi:hypothetical protein